MNQLSISIRFVTASSPILPELHWLPVKKRVEYKSPSLVYSCTNDTAPQYRWFHSPLPKEIFDILKIYKHFNITVRDKKNSGGRTASLWFRMSMQQDSSRSINRHYHHYPSCRLLLRVKNPPVSLCGCWCQWLYPGLRGLWENVLLFTLCLRFFFCFFFLSPVARTLESKY